jgi:hypothetical protein
MTVDGKPRIFSRFSQGSPRTEGLNTEGPGRGLLIHLARAVRITRWRKLSFYLSGRLVLGFEMLGEGAVGELMKISFFFFFLFFFLLPLFS